MTCRVTIIGLWSHSGTGEEWADDDNGMTAAEAQAFKRSCACFGLGRYLYHFDGVWVDLDDRKRPRTVPNLPQWASPEGWRNGLRPNTVSAHTDSDHVTGSHVPANSPENKQSSEFVRQIEAMAKPLGTAYIADCCERRPRSGTRIKFRMSRSNARSWSTCKQQSAD